MLHVLPPLSREAVGRRYQRADATYIVVHVVQEQFEPLGLEVQVRQFNRVVRDAHRVLLLVQLIVERLEPLLNFARHAVAFRVRRAGLVDQKVYRLVTVENVEKSTHELHAVLIEERPQKRELEHVTGNQIGALFRRDCREIPTQNERFTDMFEELWKLRRQLEDGVLCKVLVKYRYQVYWFECEILFNFNASIGHCEGLKIPIINRISN